MRGPCTDTVKKAVAKQTQGSYKYTYKNIVGNSAQKLYSDEFEVGGTTWRMLIFPNGNLSAEHLGIYLEVPDIKNKPVGWSQHAQLTLALSNHKDEEKRIVRDTQHRFTASESDWGFQSFILLETLHDKNAGFLGEEESITIEVFVNVISDYQSSSAFHRDYDAKKETGMVGLRNQGATCYLNSLLQTLYHTRQFRKAVYGIPADGKVNKDKDIPYAMQKLFYELQHSPGSVSTSALTKSFGWDTVDSFTQHDVQELNRVLCDHLEEKMKACGSENAVQKLYEGSVTNFIKCINVDYESSRSEPFYDLSLNVKGCKNVYESFKEYIEVETLDGENQYQAEGHGKQDAKKGIHLVRLPPVLNLQLKRFEFDLERLMNVKVNDRYEFPDSLDLEPFIDPEHREKDKSYSYTLLSVLVHAGDLGGGHYYAFIRPDHSADEWFRFDDEKVLRVERSEAIDDNFGGDEEFSYEFYGRKVAKKQHKIANAYMLVYVRDDDLAEVMGEVTSNDIPPLLRQRLLKEEEEEEMKRKELAEAHLVVKSTLVTEAVLKKNNCEDLVKDWDTAVTVKIQRTESLRDVWPKLAAATGIAEDELTLRRFFDRKNATCRPDTILSDKDLAEPIDKRRIKDFRFYAAPLKADERAKMQAEKRSLIFFKSFTAAEEKMSIVGSFLAAPSDTVKALTTAFRAMTGWPAEKELIAYEEIRDTMIDVLDAERTMQELELGEGDIVIFQDAEDAQGEHRYPTPKQYIKFLSERLLVTFKRLSDRTDDGVVLELSKKMPYEQVTEHLAAFLTSGKGDVRPAAVAGGEEKAPEPSAEPVPAANVRLTGHCNWMGGARQKPYKHSVSPNLMDMLNPENQSSDIAMTLYYEVLDEPTAEVENKKIIKFTVADARHARASEHSVRIERTSKIEDLLRAIGELDGVELDSSKPMRLMEISRMRITRIFTDSQSVSSVHDYMQLRVENVPDDLVEPIAKDVVPVQIVHFHKDKKVQTATVTFFGLSFHMALRETETVADVRRRVQEELGIADDVFATWKLAVISYAKVERYLDDEAATVASIKLDSQATLGFEHTPEKGDITRHVPAARHYGQEKAIKIYN